MLKKVLPQKPSFTRTADRNPDLGNQEPLFANSINITPQFLSCRPSRSSFLGTLPSLPVSTSLTSTLTRYKKAAMLAASSKRVARGREVSTSNRSTLSRASYYCDHTIDVLHETIDASMAEQRSYAANATKPQLTQCERRETKKSCW